MIKILVLLCMMLIPTIAFSADGVFTNLRATNARFTNFSTVNGKFHGASTGTFTGSFVGNLIGTCQVPSVVPTLDEARTISACVNKTVVVTSALTSAQSNILGPWPADRALEFKKGGSIANTTAFTFATGTTVTIPDHLYVFAGSGQISGLTEVHPESFGAVGDMTTNDSVAVQKAVDSCLSAASHYASPLILKKKYLLNAPINIDRSFDTPTAGKGNFRIVAQGEGAGFYVSSAIKMFSSTWVSSTQAVSHMISFEGVTFQSSNTALAAYVLDEKFIRVTFDKCFFTGIKAMTASKVCFSFSFTDCWIRDWTGIFFEELWMGATDVSFINNQIQGGATGTTVAKFGQAAEGIRFISNTVENTGGVVLQFVNGARGGEISGNYFEANAKTSGSYYIDLTGTGLWPVSGMTVSGNMFMMFDTQDVAHDFYAIYASGAVGLTLSGNYTNKDGLYLTNNGTLGGVVSIGNVQSDTRAIRDNIYGKSINLLSETELSGQNVYSIKTFEITKDYTSDLFNAAATTDSAVLWHQPENTLLIGFRMLQLNAFTGAGVTNLGITVGDATNNSGLFTEAMNLTGAPTGLPRSNRGVYWKGGAVGTEIYTDYQWPRDWTAYAVATGANLNTLTAGKVIFYFVYRSL